LLKSQFTDHEQPIDIRVPHWIINATLVHQERAMPIEQIPDADLRYYLVAFDGEGRERTDDPAGLMSENVVSALQEQPVTDVFVMSHGWRADVPSAKRQYAAWIGAMLACTDDLARMRTTRPDFRPLLLGLHWPSEPFGNEELGAGMAFGASSDLDTKWLVDRYAERLADTPSARAALETIIGTMATNPEPASLPNEVQVAYAVLARESGLSQDVAGAPPTDDERGEPFDAQSIYRAAQAEPVSFGDPHIGGIALLPLRLLSYRKMKDRAKQIGETGGASLLAKAQRATAQRGTRFHFMGHSFGCIVVSAMLAGAGDGQTNVRAVNSLVLVQGAMSIWSFASRIPSMPDRAGAFHRIVRDRRVTGPILTTMSRFDTAVADAYSRASLAGAWVPGGLSDQVSFEPGQQDWPQYAAIGALGLRGEGLEIEDLDLQVATQPYSFQAGRIYNLQSSNVIREGGPPSGAHGDFLKPEVGHAVWEAA